MKYQNNNTESRKSKRLSFKEHHFIEIRLKDGFPPNKVAKELKGSINKVLNEISA